MKDNIWLKGFPSRRGSLTSRPAPMKEDAPAVARLRESGAVILGKTTLPEFGWIGVCHSPLTGITRNPWKLDRTPGGSSGGAAAAALLNLGHLHIGTDGAGSIRIPAAFTGVFGIKPSFGRVAAYPASPFSILAHVGPLTRTVTDAALMLSVIGGPDTRDMTAWNTPTPDYRVGLDGGVRGLRVAWSPRLGYVQKLDPQIEAATKKAAQAFGDLGAIVEEADPGFTEPYEMIMTLWGAVSAMIVAAAPESDRAKMDPGFLKLAEEGARYSLADYLAAFTARAGPRDRDGALPREIRPAADPADAAAGDRSRPRHAAGRQLRRALDRVVALHLSVQPDPAAGRLRAVRLHVRRPADRAADRRPGAAGSSGAARRARLRKRPPVRHFGRPAAKLTYSKLA